MLLSAATALSGKVVATEGLILYLALLCVLMVGVIAVGVALRHRSLR